MSNEMNLVRSKLEAKEGEEGGEVMEEIGVKVPNRRRGGSAVTETCTPQLHHKRLRSLPLQLQLALKHSK